MTKLSTKSLQKAQERLIKKNAEFAAMSIAEKRVAIAKDVLAQLDAKKLVAKSANGYMEYRSEEAEEKARCMAASAEESNLADLTSQVKCTVCGIGSLFVAAIERDLNFKTGKTAYQYSDIDREVMVDHLSPYFTSEELDMIEAHFEQSYGESEVGDDEKIINEPSDTKRLRKIMRNIIKNNGHFVPGK